MSAVMAVTGLSRTTLWRLRQTGDFPNPIHLGGSNSRAVGWLRGDIEAWTQTRPAAQSRNPTHQHPLPGAPGWNPLPTPGLLF
ncbi:MAG: AlpA family phage regulatory protein [bacterium]|nr:AlpA family phage regulatory protein [bacterium]